ncbi:MAG: hypothetical protein RJB60_2877 [Pseudomonadota bacterium]
MHDSRIDLRARACLWAALAALALLWTPSAWAHKASDAYLQWRQEGQLVALRWDVAVRDLQALMPLDTNDDGRITWGELKAHQAEIDGYMLSHLRLQAGSQNCHLRPVPQRKGSPEAAPLERRSDGAYYVLRLAATCPAAPGAWQLSYRFMQEVDPTHRGLLSRLGGSEAPLALVPDGRLTPLPGKPERMSMMDIPSRHAAVSAWPGHLGVRQASYLPELTPDAASSPKAPQDHAQPQPTALAAEPAARASPWQLLRDGVHHILIGTDHVLFLICLVLPSVLVRQGGRPGLDALAPVPRAKQAFMPVLGAVTMFTIAHSITLGLAGSGLVNLSPRVVEPGIALTIALAAIDNVKPIFGGRRHLFTFLFGLVHGFGFAGVLAELNLPTAGFAWALLQFNLGVELGQLMVLVPTMALLLPLRHWRAYPHQLMPALSMAALVVALAWWVERVFNLGFMPI